jgi:cell division septation protein DedD
VPCYSSGMKRWGWIVVAALVLLGVGFAWFWSLAAVGEDAAQEVSLHVDRSPVTVTMPGEAQAREASNGMTLPEGAVVKTGEGGRAVIRFYHQAETRLDSNTELTVTKSMVGSAEASTNVQVSLTAGRAWSRVLRLFDLDSSFEVKTPSVVATVRGTAFDVRANSDGTATVWVSESAVSIAPTAGGVTPTLPTDNAFRVATSTPALTAGESAQYGRDGKVIWRKPISVEDKASAWFAENRAADEIFQRDEAARLRKELDGRSDTVGRAIESVTRLSERLHLAVAKDAKEERLAEIYISRHIASAVTLAEAGKAGLAAQAFSRIESDLKRRLGNADGDVQRRRLQAALERVSPMIQEAAPGSAAYPFKQRLEDLAVLVVWQDEAAVLYARLRATDARLDEADQLMGAGTLEEAKNALTAAHDGLGNALRDSASVLPSMEETRKAALTGKLIALLARTATGQSRLNALLAPAPVAATSTTATTSTSPTVPTTPKPTVPTQTTPTGESAYAGIGLYAQPNPVDPGGNVTLSAIATKVGGGTEDVSSRATYRIVSGVGTLTGKTFLATVAGTVTFEAKFVDQGKEMISRAALTVNGATAVLQNLTASAAPATIMGGSRTTLSAMASYTTGFQQDVGTKAVWENLSPTMGTLSGNVFTAATTAYGTAQFEATYTEGGVTKKASVSVTITQNTQYPARGPAGI